MNLIKENGLHFWLGREKIYVNKFLNAPEIFSGYCLLKSGNPKTRVPPAVHCQT